MSISGVRKVTLLSVTSMSGGVIDVTIINQKTGQHFKISGHADSHPSLAALCELLLAAEVAS